VAQLPSTPYTLKGGSNVPINVTVDLRGKMGLITKSISVDSSAGFKSLLVKVNIPQPTNNPAEATIAGGQGMDRAKNIQASLTDRQAVFKGNCVECHVQKGIGKMGKDLYAADCGVCHDAEHRAAMVPDLKVPRTHRDIAFFKKWIEEGKAGTLMPAFATSQGGPLTQEQIDSLVVYLYQTLPKDPPLQAQAPQPPPLPIPAAAVPQKN
jgi:mono/diheme cytochrome c family protein